MSNHRDPPPRGSAWQKPPFTVTMPGELFYPFLRWVTLRGWWLDADDGDPGGEALIVRPSPVEDDLPAADD